MSGPGAVAVTTGGRSCRPPWKSGSAAADDRLCGVACSNAPDMDRASALASCPDPFAHEAALAEGSLARGNMPMVRFARPANAALDEQKARVLAERLITADETLLGNAEWTYIRRWSRRARTIPPFRSARAPRSRPSPMEAGRDSGHGGQGRACGRGSGRCGRALVVDASGDCRRWTE